MESKAFIPNFYQRFNIGGINVDFYRICRLYEVTDPCIQHALKKLLRAGRSHKSVAQDIKDAVDTLLRYQVMETEDAPQSINMCSPQASDQVEEEPEILYSYRFFPINPIWYSGILDCLENWKKSGWYIVESHPFANTLLPFILPDVLVAAEFVRRLSGGETQMELYPEENSDTHEGCGGQFIYHAEHASKTCARCQWTVPD